MTNGIEQGDGGQRCRGQGQINLHIDDQIVGAIQLGGFFQAFRNLHKEIAQDDQIVGADRHGQYEHPKVVHQP